MTRRAVGPLAARFTLRTAAFAVRVALAARDIDFRALLRAPFLGEADLRRGALFLAEDLRAGDFRADDFLAEDFRPVPEREVDFRERERLAPLFLRAPDFFDVAMEMTP